MVLNISAGLSFPICKINYGFIVRVERRNKEKRNICYEQLLSENTPDSTMVQLESVSLHSLPKPKYFPAGRLTELLDWTAYQG